MAGGIRAAQKALNDRVMGKPGVNGTAIGEQAGEPCLKVYVDDRSAAGQVPKAVDGYPVVVEVSGSFRRL